MCRYCDEKTIQSTPVRSNCDPVREHFDSLIVNAYQGMELIITIRNTAYGIPLNFCPFCGRKFDNRNTQFIDSFTNNSSP